MSKAKNCIKENLTQTNHHIKLTASKYDRNSDDIELLAVSKTKPVSDILLAYESGQRHFGENYVQEGVEKIHNLKRHPDLIWHFIGPLQSNKSRLVAENFDWMHSVDRVKIAKRLNDQRPVFKSPLNICIQVNIDEESTKSGVAPEELFELAEQLESLERLKLRGLMTIPKSQKSDAELAKSFAKMLELFKQGQKKYPNFDTLSMGMSSDIELAIANGSTMVRVGTAIFGKRS